MKAPRAPRLETRRTADFSRELHERTIAWIPSWDVTSGQGDFGQALLEIAARFSSEVAERLDRTGDKMRRGFLDWLGVRGKAARPARMPVVFKLSDSAQEAVEALAPIRLQVDAAGTPVIFETETSLNLVPAHLQVVAAADPAEDAYYLPPPDLSSLNPLEHLPTQWKVRSFAPAGATTIQLSPELGLTPGLILGAGGHQYRIAASDKDLVTIEPPLLAPLEAGATVSKVDAFSPFDGEAHNWQDHILYLGDSDLLNVEAAAAIAIVGAGALQAGIRWEFWGKKGSEEAAWRELAIVPPTGQNVANALLLTKPEGAMEQKEIQGRNGRWIRAYAETVPAAQEPFTARNLAIQINPQKCAPAACPSTDPAKPPQADAMANNTPLVLESLFYPLGKESRQFDAFYLGSNEAFSKKGANVQLCFEMADRTFSALSAVRGVTFGANRVLVGVAKDRALHLLEINPGTGSVHPFRQRNPLYPPSPAFGGSPQPGAIVLLDKQPRWRPPVWPESFFSFSGFLTAVCSGSSVWIWHEHPFTTPSGWVNFGQLPSSSTQPADVDSLVFLTDGGTKLAALRGKELYVRDWPSGADWIPTATKNGGATVSLSCVVAVRALTSDGFGGFTESGTAGMVGLDVNGAMFQVSPNGACTPLLPGDQFNIGILPAALQVDGKLMVAGVLKTGLSLVANHATSGRVKIDSANLSKALVALEPVIGRGGVFHVLITTADGGAGTLMDWAPFDTPTTLFSSPITAGTPGGAPVEADGSVVVPGTRADILSIPYDPHNRIPGSAPLLPGIVVGESFPQLAVDDLIVRIDSFGDPVPIKIKSSRFVKDGEAFYSLQSAFPADASRLDAFRLAHTFPGTLTATLWQLDSNDQETTRFSWLRIGTEFFHVDDISLQRKATLSSPSGAVPVNGPYTPGMPTNGHLAPFMKPVPGTWDASLLSRSLILFPKNDPDRQRGKAFDVDGSGHPALLVFDAEFQDTIPHPFSYVAPPFPFLVDAAFGEWSRDIGDSSTNPELSWEYWNGQGWWRLEIKSDDTLNLKITGALRFTVPADIEASDWAGKTNPWIRARLIGGDYGREKVTFDGQTVTRSTENIRPPSVLKLTISYGLCQAVLPTFLLTSDSGSVRDQSNANRSSGAIIEAFVPLALTLGRLINKPAAAITPPTQEICPPPCDCPGQPSTTTAPAASQPAAASAGPSTERCLLVGISGSVSGAPVNILLQVDSERPHAQFAPLTVEALVANQFVPIVASDGTRALGETGLISMSFAVPPATAELFGQSLIWLRLTPKLTANPAAAWNPSIRGAYLNAAFASATETLTRELVGSSEGAPGVTLTLARPPLLADSLELRVREPLGDEERADLAEQGLVISDPDGLPGDWVRWKQVPDPGDEPPASRVYALDESTGEIRFGDGLHGMIPPIGRDSIVAFRYQRTEPPPAGSDAVPGNLIAARTTLNLVSPVETVESVTSAGNSAGGAAPESDELVLQFGYARLRHRDQALTLRDLEDIALESSPAIVQARAFSRSGGKIRLVAVMRGKDPRPNAAQIRELRRYLLSFAPAAIAAPDALTIAPPELRYLRLELDLEVETLDSTARVSAFVKSSFAGLFDSTWTLGQNPTEDDIATVLAPAPGLESIANIALLEVTADGSERRWPDQLKPTELAVLAADPVRLQFQSREVTA